MSQSRDQQQSPSSPEMLEAPHAVPRFTLSHAMCKQVLPFTDPAKFTPAYQQQKGLTLHLHPALKKRRTWSHWPHFWAKSPSLQQERVASERKS